MSKIKKAWKNKYKILEGIRYTLFPNKYVEMVAKRRSKICQSNICGLYDKFGTAEATVIKGKPACGGCGCNELIKVRSLSSECYLKEMGLKPMWEAEMSVAEEDSYREKVNLKNN